MCLTILAAIALVRDSPSGASWAAVGALAAVAQALGVFLALIYASGQIRQAQRADAQRRREQLLDRLDNVTFSDLESSIGGLYEGWDNAVRYDDVWMSMAPAFESTPEDKAAAFKRDLRELWTKNRRELLAHHKAALGAADRFQRYLRYLGYSQEVDRFALRERILEFKANRVSVDVSECLTNQALAVATLQGSLIAVQEWVEDLLETSTPTPR